jgi:flavin reductase (DIM6/NTAB) family NADH-FMN oxidoreductase RutF
MTTTRPTSASAAKRGIDPATLEPSAVYKILAGCVVPRPIAFISSVSADGTANAAPFSFFNVVSHKPPLLSVSISKIYASDSPKDTLNNIVGGKDFVVNIVSNEIVDAGDVCSGFFPPHVDEIAVSGLTALPGTRVKSPRIAESPVSFECRLSTVVALPGSVYTLVIGEIVYMHVRDDLLSPAGHIDFRALDAVGRMAGRTYARTRDTFVLDHDTFSVVAASDRKNETRNEAKNETSSGTRNETRHETTDDAPPSGRAGAAG